MNVFYRTFGSRSNPAFLMIHGYVRASFDYREIISRLQDDYFIVALDFPGYGFSDKPQDGYSYMVEDDAKLLDYFVREIVGLSQVHILTHSRGSSVGLALLGHHFGRRGEPVRDHLPLHLQYQHVPAPGQQLSRPVRPPGP